MMLNFMSNWPTRNSARKDRSSDYTIKTQPIVRTTLRNQKLTKVYVQSNMRKQLTVHIRDRFAQTRGREVVFECLCNSSYTQWCSQSSEKQSHTWQYCCLLSYAFNCASVSWTFWQSVKRFQFFIRPGLHFFNASIFTVIHSFTSP